MSFTGGIMSTDPIRGKTIRWTFIDGPMAKRTFEHTFDEAGTVTYRAIDGNGGKPGSAQKYEAAEVGTDVWAVSYLSPSGYTLTVVLDYRTSRLVAFASNEKELTVQKGTFDAPAS
jgi:hypothetical protein